MNINEQFELQQQEITELKCQASELRAALVMFFNGGWDDEHTEAINDQVKAVILRTPEQCINSVKADAINDFINDIANMEVKGNKGTNKAEYYKAALRSVFLCGKHVVTKLRAINKA